MPELDWLGSLGLQHDLDWKSFGDLSEFFACLFKFRKLITSHFLLQDPVKEIKRLNHFMGTKRSAGLIEQITGAINFSKMKEFMLASQKVYLLFWMVDTHNVGYLFILTTCLYWINEKSQATQNLPANRKQRLRWQKLGNVSFLLLVQGLTAQACNRNLNASSAIGCVDQVM